MSAIAKATIPVQVVDTQAAERRMMFAFLCAGFSALMIGASIGPMQALNYDGINVYPYLRPALQTYYQGLTVHGVLNAYVFTFFVASGLLVYLPARELKISPNMALWYLCFAMMAIGTLMLLYAMFDNSSSVLWTFFPPLKGSPFFYLGLTLLVVGSLLPAPIVLEMRARWKASQPGEITPIVTYMSAATMLTWLLAALGAVAELVFMVDPWVLGLSDSIDPMIARTLFWWTGHPIVYYWLMPVYLSWYALLPQQVGGKLVRDSTARLAFALLLVFSLPVGSHHQFMDPGISSILKGIIMALTLSVALPSLITAFTVGASLEYAGRLHGGRGLIGWFTALPWRDPSVAAQILAMITFVFAGGGGIVQGSWQLDNIIHNTIWVPGHFHIAVGTVTAMTFMGIALWMLPHLTGRALISTRLAQISVWLWFIGMSVFSLGMHWAGLYGVPRRAWVSSLPQSAFERVYGLAHLPLTFVAVGGVVLWLATLAFYIVFFGSLFSRHLPASPQIPFAQALVVNSSPPVVTRTVEHLGLLTVFTLITTIAVYLAILWPLVQHTTSAHGWKVW